MISVEIDKRKDNRTIRVLGKFRHLDKEEMANLEALRSELISKFKL